MQFAQKNSPLPGPYSDITLYADLSRHTLLAQKKLVSLTKLLCNHDISYRWGFPAKLLVFKNHRTIAIHTAEEGL